MSDLRTVSRLSTVARMHLVDLWEPVAGGSRLRMALSAPAVVRSGTCCCCCRPWCGIWLGLSETSSPLNHRPRTFKLGSARLKRGALSARSICCGLTVDVRREEEVSAARAQARSELRSPLRKLQVNKIHLPSHFQVVLQMDNFFSGHSIHISRLQQMAP